MANEINFKSDILNGKIELISTDSIKPFTAPEFSFKSLYIGNFDWGSCFNPVEIFNPSDFEKIFGNMVNEDNIEDYTTVSNYLSYGGSIIIMRVLDVTKFDQSGIVRSNYSMNGVLSVNVKGYGSIFYDQALACLILNRNDFMIQHLGNRFPPFQSHEKIRFYVKYPSFSIASRLRISICNYEDIDHAEIFDGVLFKKYLKNSLAPDEIAVMVSIDGEIIEDYILSTTVGARNSNNETYFIDDYLMRHSNLIYSVMNKNLTGEIPSVKNAELRYGNVVQVSSTVKTGFISHFTGVRDDLHSIFSILEGYRYSIMVDSFQSSYRCLKLNYSNSGSDLNFVLRGKQRIRSNSVVGSDRKVYEFYYFTFNNGDNPVGVVESIQPDTPIYYKVSPDVTEVAFIRSAIIDSTNNVNVIMVESDFNIVVGGNIYLDELCTIPVVTTGNGLLHSSADTIDDAVDIQGSQFSHLDPSGSVDSIGVFTIPNIFQILDHETIQNYIDLLIADDRYNTNCFSFIECQCQNFRGVYNIVSSAGDIAGNWSRFSYLIENRNFQYYDFVPFNYSPDIINLLSRKMFNVINYSQVSMSLESANNDYTKDLTIRLPLNKIKNDIRSLFDRFLFGKNYINDLNRIRNKLYMYKTDKLFNNDNESENKVESFKYRVVSDLESNSVRCECSVSFYGIVDSIRFNIVRNLTR
jgi:hypothetical protein